MQKKVYKIIINALVFIVFSTFMPGFLVTYGAVGHIIVGLGYGFVYNVIPWILHFFKLPPTIFLKIIAGVLLISGYLALASSSVLNFIKISNSYIGNTDFILFNIPKLISLDSQLSVIIASAIILLGCSIIIEKIKK